MPYSKVFAIINELHLKKNYQKEFYDASEFKNEYKSVQGYMDCRKYMALEEMYEKIKYCFGVKHVNAFIKYHARISKPNDITNDIECVRISNKDFVVVEKGYYYLDYIIRRIREHISGKIDLKEINNPLIKEDAMRSDSKTIYLGEKHYYISELVTKELHEKFPEETEKMYSDINIKYDDVYAGYYGTFDDVSSWN